jgi:hypothetical protein
MNSIADDTPLIPEVLAYAGICEAGELSDLANAPAEALFLADCVECYYAGAGGLQFAKRVRPKHGQEHLMEFMRHWLVAEQIKAGASRCQLPYEWGTGGTPLDLNPKLKD